MDLRSLLILHSGENTTHSLEHMVIFLDSYNFFDPGKPMNDVVISMKFPKEEMRNIFYLTLLNLFK